MAVPDIDSIMREAELLSKAFLGRMIHLQATPTTRAAVLAACLAQLATFEHQGATREARAWLKQVTTQARAILPDLCQGWQAHEQDEREAQG